MKEQHAKEPRGLWRTHLSMILTMKSVSTASLPTFRLAIMGPVMTKFSSSGSVSNQSMSSLSLLGAWSSGPQGRKRLEPPMDGTGSAGSCAYETGSVSAAGSSLLLSFPPASSMNLVGVKSGKLRARGRAKGVEGES